MPTPMLEPTSNLLTRIDHIGHNLPGHASAMRKMLRAFAHDFNNVLAIVSTNLEMIQDDLRKDTMSYSLCLSALEAVDVGARMTQDILAAPMGDNEFNIDNNQKIIPPSASQSPIFADQGKLITNMPGSNIKKTADKSTNQALNHSAKEKMDNKEKSYSINPLARNEINLFIDPIRILLVESDADNRDRGRQLLIDMGHQVITADSAQAGLDILEIDQNFELMITDIMLPGGVSGISVARNAKEISSEIKVIFMSGYTTDATGMKITSVAGARMIAKPFIALELAHALKDVIALS